MARPVDKAARPSRRALLAAVLTTGLTVTFAGRSRAADTSQFSSQVDGLVPGETGTVARLHAADTLELTSGMQVRLSGIQLPDPGRDGGGPWPFADDAEAAVGELAVGRRIGLYYDADRRDRWRRAIAHVVLLETGVWLQARLLEMGLARVRTTPQTALGSGALLAAERSARARGTGLWAHPFYRIRNPNETWGDLDSFQIVEGRVVDAAAVRGTAYLNFGTDWRRDFTFRLRPPARRALLRAGLDPASLVGRRVRGRGWVFPANGPMIDLTHRAQLEVLDD